MFLITIPIILFKGFDIFKQQPDDEEEAKKQGRWLLALQFALSVAVGLTPEMLPALVSRTLHWPLVVVYHQVATGDSLPITIDRSSLYR